MNKRLRNTLFICSLILLLFCTFVNAQDHRNNKFTMQYDSLISKYRLSSDSGLLDHIFSKGRVHKNYKLKELLLHCLADSDKMQISNILQRYDYLVARNSENRGFSNNSNFTSAEIDTFKKYIVKKFPQFEFFIFSNDSVTIKDIQDNYIIEKQAILDYYITENYVHIIIISQNSCSIISNTIDQDRLISKLDKFNKSFRENNDLLNLSFDIDLAYQLYNILVKPVIPYLGDIHTLIIIPDEILWGLPFECLVTSADKPGMNDNEILYSEYMEVEFLIKKFAIAYNFTIRASFFKFHPIISKEELGRKLLTLDPVFNTATKIDSVDTLCSEHKFKFSKHSNQEIYRVSRLLWRHENLTGEKVSKTYFKKSGGDYRWIYLTSPTILNNENPDYSAIYFPKLSNADGEACLTINELINFRLNADLITLSHSELSPGGTTIQPGVTGIPQTLLMAGARSVIFSLWNIQDISVSRFMAKFYWELKFKRHTNLFALQETKLASLKETISFGNREISRAHPFFWASFILIGDFNIRPPTFSTVSPYMVIMIVYGIVFVVSFIIVRRTLDKNGKI